MGLFDFFKKNSEPEPEKKTESSQQHELSNLEKGALIYYKNKKYYSGIFAFQQLVKQEPENVNAWYGLGACLSVCGKSAGITDLIKGAIACFKTSLKKTNNQHKFSQEFLDKIKQDSILDEMEIEGIKPLSIEEITKVVSGLGVNNSLLVSEFSELNNKDRMIQLIFIGETGESVFFSIIKHAILNDSDTDVKFAALKRVHLYRNCNGFEQLLEDAFAINKNDELEPYFAMAINKINESWVDKYKGNAYRQLFGSSTKLN